ncbi:MAG: glutaredoxin 3 [Sphingomonadaceae bacterium]
MSTPKVEIYTKWGCPYCVRAKALLDGKGVAYEEYDVTLGGPKRAEMEQRVPGARTVPQIIVEGQALGGCDDIVALDRAGKLDPLLGR